jgi:hypothetical protein
MNTSSKPSADLSQGLSEAEIANEGAQELPDREALSIIGSHGCMPTIGNIAIPINEASASNVDSVSSTAIADADQIIVLDQTTTVTEQ